MIARLSSTYSRAAVLVVMLAMVLVPLVKLCAAQDAPWTAVSPAPSASYRVGPVWRSLVDSKRNDPFLRNGSKRELLVRFWYPAVIAGECMPAEYSSRDVWTYESELIGMPLPRVRTNSCLRAQPVSGVHPVIVASHGYTGTLTDYTF